MITVEFDAIDLLPPLYYAFGYWHGGINSTNSVARLEYFK